MRFLEDIDTEVEKKRIVWSDSRDKERVNKKIQIIKLH